MNAVYAILIIAAMVIPMIHFGRKERREEARRKKEAAKE